MPLVVDCCSLVHAKAMRALDPSPLDLLSELAAMNVRFVCTAPVMGELWASTLRDVLDSWTEAGWLTIDNPTSNQRKETLNLRHKADPIPGKNDVGLIAVARRLTAPLLTHDQAASQLARRCGVTVIDLIDLAAWAAHAQIASEASINQAWRDLTGLPWPGPNTPWQGSVALTIAARPRMGEVLAVLQSRSS